MNWIKRNSSKVAAGFAGVGAAVGASTQCHAAFTLPTLPVTDLESAGTAVAALVASFVLIKLCIRMIKGA